MGKPAPTGVEQANALVSGSFTNTGTTTPLLLYGAFNFAAWGIAAATMTTTNGVGTALISTNTGLANGQGISSTNVPVGTVVGSLSTNTMTLVFPPGHTNTEVFSGVDSTVVFGPAAWSGTLQLEKSFDGGVTFLAAGIGGSSATGSIYTGSVQGSTPLAITAFEPELGINYRVNVTAYTSGTINVRLSASGLAAMTWGVPSGR